MKISKALHIYCGLSISRSQARQIAREAVVHGPIKRGDIPIVLEQFETPGRIVIIDGVFHSTESVSLSEIGDAISKKWEIIGCSSIGALRALEAQCLGMQGSGAVFRWMRFFRIEDDDEVAQIMDPESHKALSMAMIDIRWQVSRLIKSRVLDVENAKTILREMKALYYPNRTEEYFAQILSDHCQRHTIRSAESPLSLKHRDALQLISLLGRLVA